MKYALILLIGIITLTLNSCSTAEAEKVADEFHQKLDEPDIEYIMDNLIDQSSNDEESLDEFRNYLIDVVRRGNHKNRKQTNGFNKKYNDGVTTVKLNYTFEVEGELIHERLVLVKRDEGYKVLAVSMHPDEDVVIDFTAAY